jgi:hypothetical protein
MSLESPGSVVQAQLDAFNRRDVDALLAVYADDAEMYEHPSKLVAKGSSALRARFAVRFQESNLHARLLSRIVMGSTVVDHELVTRTFPDGQGTIELTMIYAVEAGRISKAWSIAGPRKLTT